MSEANQRLTMIKQEEERAIKHKWHVFLKTVLGVFVVLIVLYVYFFHNQPFGSDGFGQFGDYLGGILNPLIGMASVYFLYNTIREQVKFNAEQLVFNAQQLEFNEQQLKFDISNHLISVYDMAVKNNKLKVNSVLEGNDEFLTILSFSADFDKAKYLIKEQIIKRLGIIDPEIFLKILKEVLSHGDLVARLFGLSRSPQDLKFLCLLALAYDLQEKEKKILRESNFFAHIMEVYLPNGKENLYQSAAKNSNIIQ